MNTLAYKLFYSRFLPHIQPPGATFFITYRLANSIPKAVVEDLMREWRESTGPLKKLPDPDTRHDALYTERRRFFGRWDTLLDKAEHSPHWLTQPDVAPIILENLHRIRRYVLNNPVKAGLVDDPEAWPYSYAKWL